ncbi:MAG: hypothetical protein N4J56_004231 [Chroococcidiopsis sp. SAG 2025]|nr:hypothetical protein [Chroococcidiopsis sp. SAG 2025]
MTTTGDRPIHVFRLTPALALRWSSLSIILFVVTAAAISTFYQVIHGYKRSWIFDAAVYSQQAWQIMLFLVYFVAIPLGTFLIHKLIHGLAFIAFGGKPRSGVGIEYFLPYAYTTAPRRRFSRNAFLVISLTPLFVIDAIAILLLAVLPQAPWLGWVAILNTAGASGDLWIATLLLRCPRSITVEDRKTGVAIYAPLDLNACSLPFRQPSGRVKSAFRNWVDLTVLMLGLIIFVSFLLPVLFDILNVPSFLVGTDDLWLLNWENNAKGFAISFNLWLWIGIATILSLVAVLFKSVRDR